MTMREYKKHTSAFLQGKHGVANTQIENKGGEVIEAGSIVVFEGKSARGGFNIRSLSGVTVTRVDPADVDLMPAAPGEDQ